MDADEKFPVLTDERFRRLVDGEANWYRSYADVLRAFDDNFMGIEIRDEPCGAYAVAARRNSQHVIWNRLRLADRLTPPALDEVLAWLRERQSAGHADAIAGLTHNGRLLEQFEAAGWRQRGFWHVYWGLPRDTTPEMPPNVEIREYRAEDDQDAFVTAFCDGEEEIAAEIRAHCALADAQLANDPEWTVFTALVDGQPVGFGCLHMRDGIGSIAGGWTMASARGQGAHLAVILARIRHAHRHGCDLVLSQSGITGASPRNLYRAGLRGAFTIALWKNLGK